MSGKRWSADEIEFIRANADTMTGPQIAEHLNRGYPATMAKAGKLGIHIRATSRFSRERFLHVNGSIQIGSRRLIAKTCKGCGRLLSARRFARYQSGPMRGCWDPRCLSCVSSKNYAVNREAAIADRGARLDKLQAYTKPLAFAAGTPWGDADLDLVRDTSKSILEVAVMAGRTYSSVRGKATKEGIQRRPNPDQHKNWIVQLQRASVEAAFELEPMDPTGIPREEDWDWDDQQVSA